MGRLLRDPGAEVLVGLLSFAVAVFAIGLALTAIHETKPGFSLNWTYAAFGLGALLLTGSLCVFVYLVLHLDTLHGYQTKMGSFLREGYGLRRDILANWQSGLEKAAYEWVSEVQGWLDANLPDQAVDFGLDTIVTAGEEFIYSGDEQRSKTALLIEQRTIVLREILREIRR